MGEVVGKVGAGCVARKRTFRVSAHNFQRSQSQHLHTGESVFSSLRIFLGEQRKCRVQWPCPPSLSLARSVCLSEWGDQSCSTDSPNPNGPVTPQWGWERGVGEGSTQPYPRVSAAIPWAGVPVT
jgi:hypothetical protein